MKTISCALLLLALSACSASSALRAPTDDAASVRLLGEHGYARVYERDGAFKVAVLTPGREPVATLTITPGAEASEPVLSAQGEGVLVAWSEQGEAGERSVRALHWTPGSDPRVAAVTRDLVAQLPTREAH